MNIFSTKQGKILNVLNLIKIKGHKKADDNMTHIEEMSQSTETDPEMTHMIELATKTLKVIMISLHSTR